MNQVGTRLPAELYARFDFLAQELDRKKGYLLRQAIEHYLEDHEDYLLAMARLAKKGQRIPLDQLEKELDLED